MRMCVNMMLAFLFLVGGINGIDKESGPEFTFLSKRIVKYDNIAAGEIITRNVRFKNTGDKPLLITDIGKTCTCTSVEYPVHEIGPGEEGEISIHVNTYGKSGLDIVVVTIYANDKQKKHVTRLDIDVIPDSAEDEIN